MKSDRNIADVAMMRSPVVRIPTSILCDGMLLCLGPGTITEPCGVRSALHAATRMVGRGGSVLFVPWSCHPL
jgi:hypothetical protein